MAKLTLSVDKSVVSRAKTYAKREGISISQLIETYLAAVSQAPELKDLPPVLRSLKGSLKKADVAEYRKHLGEKYR